MRSILLIAAVAIVCQAAAHANEPLTIQFAQASPQADPPAAQAAPAPEPAPATPAAPAAPAPQASPAAAAPEAAAPPAPKATKPAKKRVAKRHNWEADEAKARSIAAKYGVTW
jgi:hypothetical protein